jgi:hypothetical protein
VHAEHLPAYDELRAKLATLWNITDRGDPEATGPAILQLVDADDPPLRIFFGRGPLEMIRTEYAQRIATWEQWNELSQLAHGNP